MSAKSKAAAVVLSAAARWNVDGPPGRWPIGTSLKVQVGGRVTPRASHPGSTRTMASEPDRIENDSSSHSWRTPCRSKWSGSSATTSTGSGSGGGLVGRLGSARRAGPDRDHDGQLIAEVIEARIADDEHHHSDSLRRIRVPLRVEGAPGGAGRHSSGPGPQASGQDRLERCPAIAGPAGGRRAAGELDPARGRPRVAGAGAAVRVVGQSADGVVPADPCRALPARCRGSTVPSEHVGGCSGAIRSGFRSWRADGGGASSGPAVVPGGSARRSRSGRGLVDRFGRPCRSVPGRTGPARRRETRSPDATR
jgi:hypothetical protein